MKTILFWAIPVYAVFSLIGMAPANLGFCLVLLVYFFNIFLFKKSFRATPLFAIQEPNFQEKIKPYYTWGFLLFCSCMISLICALFWPFSYAGHAPDITFHGFHKIWYLIVPFILVSVFLQNENLENQFQKMIKAWWITTLCLGPLAIYQFYTGWPLLQRIPTNPGRYHAILFQGHHLSVASIFLFPCFTAFACTIGAYTRDKKILPLETVVSLTGILILFLSYARTAWLAIPIGIILLFSRYLSRKSLFAGIAGLGLCLLALSQTSFTHERIKNSMGIQDRFRLWEANIDFFKHRPLTGIGWLKTQEMSEFYFKEKFPEHYHDYFWGHAHNNIFEMLGGAGLLGLLAFLGWSFFTFQLARKLTLQNKLNQKFYLSDFSWGIFVSLFLLHFNGLTNVTFWEGKVMHQQMLAVGMLLMVAVISRKKHNTHKPPFSS